MQITFKLEDFLSPLSSFVSRGSVYVFTHQSTGFCGASSSLESYLLFIMGMLSHVRLTCPTCHKAPLSMEFSRQEYWNGLPFSPPGDLPNPGMEPSSPAWQANSLPLSYLGKTWKMLPFVLTKKVNTCLFKIFFIESSTKKYILEN